MTKRKTLIHSALAKHYPQIEPAKNFIPDWFKNATRFKDGMSMPKRFPFDLTFKMCSSFSEAFTTGYMIPLSGDILVDQSESGPVISWNDATESYIILRETQENAKVPAPNGYSENQYAWLTKHMFKIPKGYTAMISHPMNRYDLPFITLGGFVDGEITLHNGHIPVFFSNSFEGLIPAGTPIAQILLFKTEDWQSNIDDSIIEEGYINSKKSTSLAFGWYKKNIWKKKVYE